MPRINSPDCTFSVRTREVSIRERRLKASTPCHPFAHVPAASFYPAILFGGVLVPPDIRIFLLRLEKILMYAERHEVVVLSTGSKNPQFGIYEAACCGYEIVLIDSALFPDCPQHKQPTEWTLVTPIESAKTKKSDPAA